MKRYLLAALVAVLAAPAARAQEMRLLRYPAIHGDTVVFTYASDLWVGDRRGGFARRLTSHPGEERLARISPDGALVAFAAGYDGDPDIYVMPVEGGAPTRLTWDALPETPVGWTPDGKVAYTSAAGSFTTRQERLWLVEPAGGLPFETPLAEFGDGSFFADGRRVAYTRTRGHARNWRRYRGGAVGRVGIYDLAAGTYRELPSDGESSWFPMAVGESIYYASDRELGTVNLYRHDLATGADVRLTSWADADVKWPSTDGARIVYEHDGYLHAWDIAAGKDERLAIQVRSDELAARPSLRKVGKEIEDLALAPNGARLAVEARGDIFTVVVEGGEARNLTSTPGVRERSPEWSPDGTKLAWLSDETGAFQIHAREATAGAVAVSAGEVRRLSAHAGADVLGFSWSPDGGRIAYWTDDGRVFALDPETRKADEVYKLEHWGATTFGWSPDGRWIAYSAPGRNGFGVIWLYEVATGARTRVTDGFYDDGNVTFDRSGKYLYFTSARTFNPGFGRYEASLKVEEADRIYLIPLAKELGNPFFPKGEEEGGKDQDSKDEKEGGDEEAKEGGEVTKKPALPRVRIDLDGLADRAVVLPLPAGEPGLLIGAKEGVYHYAAGKLRRFDLASEEAVTIYEGPEIDFAFDGERTKLAYFGDGVLGVMEAKADQKHGAGKVDTAALEVWVEPRAEWRQMLREAWRFERDNFFRADMWGLDWPAIGARYEGWLPHVSNWSDFAYVLGQMVAELGTSHAYVDGPPADSGAAERDVTAALLGADYERDGRWVRFRRVYPGTLTQDPLRGPLGEPGLGIADGDYLLAIDGRPVEAGVHPGSLLVNKAGRVVTLTVNDRPTLEGARTVRVRPVASESDLRYYEWVEANRREVDRLSGGRIGYIHYPNTAQGGQVAFIRGYWAQSDKDAIILDGRFNSGGLPQPMVLPTLARRWQTVIHHRKWHGGSEVQAINGPKAMLINGYAGSGGDLTPWMFRDAGLGALIGTRTMGALVGIAEARELMDGTVVTAPGYTRFDPRTGEWIAENKGISPDLEVDARPDLVAQGKDPQLEAAVAHLLAELAKNPPAVAAPKLPPPPAREDAGLRPGSAAGGAHELRPPGGR